MRLAKPHAWAAARVSLLQPAIAELELLDGRHAGRERGRREFDGLRSHLGQFHQPRAGSYLGGHHGDARCKAGTSACGNANSTGGPDYTGGELQSNAMIRITDHYNAASAGGGTDPATVRDVPFPVNLVCSNTASTAIGGSCTVTGGQPLSVFPDPTHPTRAVVEITQLEVFDGGADGSVATTPNTVFMRQGIFIP